MKVPGACVGHEYLPGRRLASLGQNRNCSDRARISRRIAFPWLVDRSIDRPAIRLRDFKCLKECCALRLFQPLGPNIRRPANFERSTVIADDIGLPEAEVNPFARYRDASDGFVSIAVFRCCAYGL